MPIIEGAEEDFSVEYTIPEHIQKLITDDFLKEFRNQLFRLHPQYSLETFAEEGIPEGTLTFTWSTALGKACLLTHNEELLDYWRTLDWYDSDLFDDQLSQMLIDRHFILGDVSKIIEEKLGIPEKDLKTCCDCGRLYTKDMMAKLTRKEKKEAMGDYRCLFCQDKATGEKYFEKVEQELREYEEKHPVEEAQ